MLWDASQAYGTCLCLVSDKCCQCIVFLTEHLPLFPEANGRFDLAVKNAISTGGTITTTSTTKTTTSSTTKTTSTTSSTSKTTTTTTTTSTGGSGSCSGVSAWSPTATVRRTSPFFLWVFAITVSFYLTSTWVAIQSHIRESLGNICRCSYLKSILARRSHLWTAQWWSYDGAYILISHSQSLLTPTPLCSTLVLDTPGGLLIYLFHTWRRH